MHGLNRIFLLGRLGNKPICYSTKNGKAYTGLSIATHRNKIGTDNSGQRETTTDWHYVRVWGSQAEICARFLTKGQPIFVEGYLSSYSKSKDAGGVEKKTSIHAVRVEFLPIQHQVDQSQDMPVDDSQSEMVDTQLSNFVTNSTNSNEGRLDFVG